jgi:hypothetical protein
MNTEQYSDEEGSCECNKQAAADSQQGVILLTSKNQHVTNGAQCNNTSALSYGPVTGVCEQNFGT